ncbi:hypothetical protein NKH18_27865 [Streptomyces sp. M10(2022)]
MAEPLRPARTATAPSPLRSVVISGALGGTFGALMSSAVNYLVIAMPGSTSANALNHVVSGLISGFLAGFTGLMTHRRKTAADTPRTAPDRSAEDSGPTVETGTAQSV